MKDPKFIFTEFASSSNTGMLMRAMREFEVTWNLYGKDGFAITFSFNDDELETAVKESIFQPDETMTIKYDDGRTKWIIMNGYILEMETNLGAAKAQEQIGEEDDEEEEEKAVTTTIQNTLTIRGIGFQTKMDSNKVFKTFENKNRKTIADEILGNYATSGYINNAMSPDNTPQKDEFVIAQFGQSDYEFFRYLGKYAGWVLCSIPNDQKIYWGSEADLFSDKTRYKITATSPYVKKVAFKYEPSQQLKPMGSVMEDESDTVEDIGGSNDQNVNMQSLEATEAKALTDWMETKSATKVSMIDFTLDNLQYGDFLVPPCTAEVFGASEKFKGNYYITKVTHKISIADMVNGEGEHSVTQELELMAEPS